MLVVVAPGAPRQTRRRLLRGAFGCLLLALIALLPAGRAWAGGLYRCTGSSGEAVFTGNTAGYTDCHRLTTPAPPPSRAKPARTAESIASVLGVRGSVETSARAVEGSFEPSLADVRGSADTDAKAVPTSPAVPPVMSGKPGQWTYAESKKALDDTAQAIAAPAGTRVLRGAVYRVVRGDGSVEYTNVAPGSSQKGHVVTMLFTYLATCAACDLHSTVRWGSVALHLSEYADTIHAASVEFGVDEAFLRAIIHAESAFNPRALSIKGAQGLMQLMPATANDMGVRDAFDADQNIRGGARYLALLLRNFNGNERLAAAAYNAGATAVLRYNGVPPYAETQVYVERVGVLRERYGAVR